MPESPVVPAGQVSAKSSSAGLGLPHLLRSAMVALLGCVLFTFLTLPRFYGDGTLYAKQVRAYDQGDPGALLIFWDFGHLLSRPMGFVLLHALRPLWDQFAERGTFQEYYVPMLVTSWIATFLAVWLTLRLIEHFDTSLSTSIVAAIAYLGVNAVLNYFQAAMPYMAGAAFLSGAVLLIHSPTLRFRPWTPLWAGALFALSAGMWFPYVVVFPAALATPFLLANAEGEVRRQSWTLVIRSVIAATVIGCAIYLIPVIQLQLFSVRQIIDWASMSAHGWSQNRRYIRFVFGFPSSYFFQSGEGFLFKRYLFHDPYAHVTLLDLMRASLVKIAAVFAYFGLLLLVLFRRKDRGPFLWFGFALASVVGFAIFVFEPSSIERYLLLLPFIFASVTIACQDNRMKWATVVFLVFMVGNNVYAHWRPGVIADYDRVEQRVNSLRGKATGNDVIFLPTFADELYMLTTGYAFHPFNRRDTLHVNGLVEPGVKSVLVWNENFGRITKDVWDRGGNMWLSKRALKQSPDPGVRWTEGDDPRVHWVEIPNFFTQFDLGEQVGDADGFVLFPKTEKNVRLVEALAAKYKPQY